jgi:hypothetical protein
MNWAQRKNQKQPSSIKTVLQVSIYILIVILISSNRGKFGCLFGLLYKQFYQFGKLATLWLFPNLSHDGKIILLVIGLFCIPIIIMVAYYVLAGILRKTQKDKYRTYAKGLT